MSARSTIVGFVVILMALSTIAWLSPPPNRVTDRGVYEASARQGIVPDCTDLHCFRVLVPWMLGSLPGPSTAKWKLYAATCNAIAALAVFHVCVLLGFSGRAARLASALSAFGFGSLYTLHDPYTSDPLMFALAPVMTVALLRDCLAPAAALGAIGVWAKEFAAAPLYMFTAYAAMQRRWTVALRTLAAANLALIVWLGLQLTLIVRFNYGYGGTASTHLLSGGALAPWIQQLTPRGALSAMFNEYGAVYVLAPAGLLFAPAALRKLAIAAIPVALALSYVQQPDRALWNFHYLVLPLAALVLDRAPKLLAWATVATFALANLRVGAQLESTPAARFALGLSVLFALTAIITALRGRVSLRPPLRMAST